MRLLGGLLSPYVMRAALAARMKGFDIPVEMPAGGIKGPDYLALNPMGKMPTLIDGDFALPESAVIAEYLEEVLDGPSILPGGPEERARARLLARVGDLYLAPALTGIFRAREAPDGVPAAIAGTKTALAHLDALRPAHAQWLAGDEHSLADATVMPIFFFLDAFEQPFGTASLIAAHEGLAHWWARARATEHGIRMVSEMSAALAAFMAPKP
ncbi:MAG: glutathione S-transferase family protein [Sphingomonadaceae bacterium]